MTIRCSNSFPRVLLLAFAALCTIGGCDRKTANSSQTQPASPANTTAIAMPDAFYIKQAVLQDLFDLQAEGASAEKTYYSAYVLENESFSNDLVAAFKGYVPLVSNTLKVTTASGAATDQTTGAPVKLFRVQITEQSATAAAVDANWYSGNLAAASYVYEMIKIDGKWRVDKRQLRLIS